MVGNNLYPPYIDGVVGCKNTLPTEKVKIFICSYLINH
ncbi:hypothetical protein BGS_1019 [Beggiatoa sp. SS]|nr:hypothetical protein BGS_1019 [Beggiatoa sp. SS]